MSRLWRWVLWGLVVVLIAAPLLNITLVTLAPDTIRAWQDVLSSRAPDANRNERQHRDTDTGLQDVAAGR